jgi:hypothetical protein
MSEASSTREAIVTLMTARMELERSLSMEIGRQVQAFRQQWGVSIEDVHVRMVEVTTMGEPLRDFIPGAVVVDLAL